MTGSAECVISPKNKRNPQNRLFQLLGLNLVETPTPRIVPRVANEYRTRKHPLVEKEIDEVLSTAISNVFHTLPTGKLANGISVAEQRRTYFTVPMYQYQETL
ncbi:hypothetical protein CLAIMM_12101, partial [Cladophialophora immunda]